MKNVAELAIFALFCLLGGWALVRHFPPGSTEDWFWVVMGILIMAVNQPRVIERWRRL